MKVSAYRGKISSFGQEMLVPILFIWGYSSKQFLILQNIKLGQIHGCLLDVITIG